jgi:hypothetical protein
MRHLPAGPAAQRASGLRVTGRVAECIVRCVQRSIATLRALVRPCKHERAAPCRAICAWCHGKDWRLHTSMRTTIMIGELEGPIRVIIRQHYARLCPGRPLALAVTNPTPATRPGPGPSTYTGRAQGIVAVCRRWQFWAVKSRLGSDRTITMVPHTYMPPAAAFLANSSCDQLAKAE